MTISRAGWRPGRIGRGIARLRRTVVLPSLVALLSVGACLGGVAASAASPEAAEASGGGGTVTYAIVGASASYILPFLTPAQNTELNVCCFSNLMYLPLYQYNGTTLNPAGSLAAGAPVYSDGNRTVTIKLKHYEWSDGSPVTSRDVSFFLNLVKANKADWAGYHPGEFPDNVASFTTPSSDTVVLHLDRAYDPAWFSLDELTDQLYAFPQKAWDEESASGPVGDYDQTTAGAEAVYKFLSKQATETSTYATNPLWKVVDGPWSLQSFQTNGPDVFVPNANYSGSKARIAKFIEASYTSDASEFNALLTGNEIQVGTIPSEDLPELGRATSAGYNFVAAPQYQVAFANLNFENPVTGPIVKQLYFRQALQHLMDENGQVQAYLDGGKAGYAVYGPVPQHPASPYASSAQSSEPYPFSVSAARALLTEHGWTIPSSGAATCTRPGSGANDCGAGISQGQQLEFNFLYDSGYTFIQEEADNFKSDAAQAGIVLNLSSSPFLSVVGDLLACVGTSKCPSSSWQMGTWSTGYSWDFGTPYATGEVFETYTNYPDPNLQKLVTATETSASPISAMHAYDTYVTRQLPVLWTISTYSLNEVSNKLKGVTFAPNGAIEPSQWYFAG